MSASAAEFRAPGGAQIDGDPIGRSERFRTLPPPIHRQKEVFVGFDGAFAETKF
jgi:hypothetical protein